jgi:hypothetical protein
LDPFGTVGAAWTFSMAGAGAAWGAVAAEAGMAASEVTNGITVTNPTAAPMRRMILDVDMRPPLSAPMCRTGAMYRRSVF